MTFNGLISQTANAPLLLVEDGHAGTLTFQTGITSKNGRRRLNSSGILIDNPAWLNNYCFINDRPISSRDLPLVSLTMVHEKNSANKQTSE